MSRIAIDLAGRRFGRLTVEKRAPSNQARATQWHCLCACGKRRIVRAQSLLSGVTKSCGCWRTEASKERMRRTRAAQAMAPRYATADAMAETFAADPRALLRRLGIA